MKYNSTFLFLLAFVSSSSAQQWQHFPTPLPPLISTGALHAVGDTVFVTWYSGLARSVDGGDNWDKIRDYTSLDGFQLFRIDPQNHYLYYSQGYDSASLWTLWRSTNLGDTWSLIGNLQSQLMEFSGDTLFGSFNGTGEGLAPKFGSAPLNALVRLTPISTSATKKKPLQGVHLQGFVKIWQ